MNNIFEKLAITQLIQILGDTDAFNEACNDGYSEYYPSDPPIITEDFWIIIYCTEDELEYEVLKAVPREYRLDTIEKGSIRYDSYIPVDSMKSNVADRIMARTTNETRTKVFKYADEILSNVDIVQYLIGKGFNLASYNIVDQPVYTKPIGEFKSLCICINHDNLFEKAYIVHHDNYCLLETINTKEKLIFLITALFND